MSHSRSALRNLAMRLFQAAIALITSVVVTKTLGAEGKGVYALLMVGPLLGARVLSLGTEAALIVRGQNLPAAERAGHGLSIVLVCGVGGVAAVLGLQALGGLPGRDLAPFLLRLFATLTLPLFLASYVLNGLLRGAGDLAAYDRGLLVGPGVQLPLALLFLIGCGWGVAGALAASLGAIAATDIYLVWSAHRRLPGSRPRRLLLDPSLLRFGAQEHVGNLAQHLNLRLDLLLVGVLLGPLETGIYTVAITLAEVVWFVPDSVGVVLLPRVARGGGGAEREAAARACRIALGAGAGLALVLGISGPTLIGLLYGKAFQAAALPLACLLPGTVFLGISKVLSKHLSGTGHPGLVARASCYSLVATVVLDLVLIPAFGLAGAAAATTLAYGLHAAICFHAFRQLTGATTREIALLEGRDLRDVVELIRGIVTEALELTRKH